MKGDAKSFDRHIDEKDWEENERRGGVDLVAVVVVGSGGDSVVSGVSLAFRRWHQCVLVVEAGDRYSQHYRSRSWYHE